MAPTNVLDALSVPQTPPPQATAPSENVLDKLLPEPQQAQAQPSQPQSQPETKSSGNVLDDLSTRGFPQLASQTAQVEPPSVWGKIKNFISTPILTQASSPETTLPILGAEGLKNYFASHGDTTAAKAAG